LIINLLSLRLPGRPRGHQLCSKVLSFHLDPSVKSSSENEDDHVTLMNWHFEEKI